MSRRLPLFLLLAFLLAFAQQASALHAMSHAVDAPAQPQKHMPGVQGCEKCLAFAEIEGAAVASELCISEPPGEALQRVVWPAAPNSPIRFAYRSRAPPRS